MKELHLKILLSHCFSTFFPFPFVHSQILIHLRHWNQNKQKAPPFIPTAPLIIFHWIFRPLCLLRPPVFSGPKSSFLGWLLDAQTSVRYSSFKTFNIIVYFPALPPIVSGFNSCTCHLSEFTNFFVNFKANL